MDAKTEKPLTGAGFSIKVKDGLGFETLTFTKQADGKYFFDENGKVVPVTVVEAGPCTVVQKKTVESDGYVAVQLGYGDISAKKVSKPAKGHFDKADVAPKRTLREFRLDDISAMNVGDILKADVFAVGDRIDVVGTSKGKGYAGAI